MPLKFWDEAFLTATFLINLLPTKVLNLECPSDKLLHVKPNYNSLRIFGCACWPNLHPYNQRKLTFRSKRCVFLGYSPRHKGVKCLDVSTGRIYISRDVVFDEQIFPFQSLHPNAGAQLRAEILLLPSSSSPSEDMHVDDHMNIVLVPDHVQHPLEQPTVTSTISTGSTYNNSSNDATSEEIQQSLSDTEQSADLLPLLWALLLQAAPVIAWWPTGAACLTRVQARTCSPRLELVRMYRVTTTHTFRATGDSDANQENDNDSDSNQENNARNPNASHELSADGNDAAESSAD
jgi:hypothetical protein